MNVNMWCSALLSYVFLLQPVVSQPWDYGLRGSDDNDDIDRNTYFCGNQLSNMLSKYCKTYNSRRNKRDIVKTCCKGLGCTIRYAMSNYCHDIKPEYYELFKTRPVDHTTPSSSTTNSEETDIFQQPKVESRSIILNSIRKSIQEDKFSPKSIEVKIPQSKFFSDTTTLNDKQVNDCTSKSSSFIGTDHVPSGRPVHSKSKYNYYGIL